MTSVEIKVCHVSKAEPSRGDHILHIPPQFWLNTYIHKYKFNCISDNTHSLSPHFGSSRASKSLNLIAILRNYNRYIPLSQNSFSISCIKDRPFNPAIIVDVVGLLANLSRPIIRGETEVARELV
jgi:hypothetical protein